MKSFLFVLLTLMLMVLMSCENPFEQIQDDIDAIKAAQNIESSIKELESLLSDTNQDNLNEVSIKENLNIINQQLNTVLNSPAAVSILKEEFKNRTGETLTSAIEEFQSGALYDDSYAKLDAETKGILDNIVSRISDAGL